VELVFGNVGFGFGQLDDLVAQGLPILPLQRLAATPAGSGLERDATVWWQQWPGMKGMAGLSTPGASGGIFRWRPFDGGSIRGRRPRRVRGVLAKSLFQLTDTLFELANALFVLLENDKQSGLNSRRDLVPQLLRDWRLLADAAGIANQLPSGKLGS